MEDVTSERWLPVVGWEGRYEVSDLGRVKSLRRLRDGTLLIYMMKPRPTVRGGHLHVRLSDYDRRCMVYVHQMVARAFIGPCPDGQEVRHWDGDPTNNRLSNLLYGTKKENSQDTIRHGRSPAGSRHYRSTLTDADVAAIKVAWRQGTSGVELAARYGVSRPAVSRIVNGRSYRSTPVFLRPPGKCHFPRCDREVAPGTNRQGMPHAFCSDPGHNNAAAKKERYRLRHHVQAA